MVQAVEEVTGAGQGSSEPAGHDGPAVRALCATLEAMLAHGLKPFAPRGQGTGWASYLPPRRATPFAMLQVKLSAHCDCAALSNQSVHLVTYCIAVLVQLEPIRKIVIDVLM